MAILQVSIRAFFPPYLILYILQFILMPLIARPNVLSTLLGNTLYLLALGYWTIITFLGYNALHFLHHTEFLLSPMVVWALLWLICCVGGINLPEKVGVVVMFAGVERLGR